MKSVSKVELEALRNSDLFDEKWYLEQYPDVKMLGMDPLEHYLWVGEKIGRKPSNHSTTTLEVDPAPLNCVNPTSMFADTPTGLTIEAAHRLLGEIFSRKGEPQPERMFQKFDASLAERFISALTLIPNLKAEAEITKVSVIMPTYNRAAKINDAINSVLGQSHNNLELIIIDDGSTDHTPEILARFKNDPRVRIFKNNHGGVSKARNTGLSSALGEIIFYLDSDNVWTSDFIKYMVMSLLYSGANCAYAASRLQTNDGKLVGYRGEPFNWDSCVRGNYVDMNVFCHRRSIVSSCGEFDEALKRMVDWDLILRYTKNNEVVYSPFIGCLYLEDTNDLNRITTSQPYVYRKIVHLKNLHGYRSVEETVAESTLNFAIKIPAPFEARAAWGDYHFAESLKCALERLGHRVKIDFLNTWYDRHGNDDDVAIVLRGLTAYKPVPGQLSLIWNISHPDQISYDEYSGFHGIFVASESYACLLSTILARDVHPLLQCTDRTRFSFNEELVQEGLKKKAPGVFVGNSRKTFRELVRWSVGNDVNIDVYGQHWEPFIPAEMIKGINIDNKELSKTYSLADFVLNDHWESMRDFGIISNRVFDVLGCGGRLVSDYIPSLSALFGRAITSVSDEATFRVQMKAGLPVPSIEERRQTATFVHDYHSFDVRAEVILEWIKRHLSGSKAVRAEEPLKPFTSAKVRNNKRRVGLLLQQGKAWPTSSAFIRLIAPLTTDAAHANLEIVQLRDANDPAIDSIDQCIVQRVAVAQHDQAEKLLDRLAERNVPLFVDTDDAFFLHKTHRDQDIVLRVLMERAQESWFSTEVLASYYDEIRGSKRIVPNCLDPRLWRNYRQSTRTVFSRGKVRFLYMGTATHDEDFDIVYPAFEELAACFPGQFDLTLIGAVRKSPQRPWINRLNPPADQGSYPKFVRWLMANNEFDVGIAPLENSLFNQAKSDVKFLDYSAMGLLSLVSDGPSYQQCIQRKLAIPCHDRNSWIENLKAVINSPSSFEKMRSRALRHVWEERSTLSCHNPIIQILAN